jgi:hypothetical protein
MPGMSGIPSLLAAASEPAISDMEAHVDAQTVSPKESIIAARTKRRSRIWIRFMAQVE